MVDEKESGRHIFGLARSTQLLLASAAGMAAVVGLWMSLGFPTPATKSELTTAITSTQRLIIENRRVSETQLAANTRDDRRFRLQYLNERRDQLYGKRAEYQRKNDSVPLWLRRDITRTCDKIAELKGKLGLDPNCQD